MTRRGKCYTSSVVLAKQKRWRSPAYLKWVKTLSCVVSGAPADDPHHIIGHGTSGMGLKAPDWAVFPLSRYEHTRLHALGWQEWEARHGSQWFFASQTLGRALNEGILT